jgi:hypothetical protein
MQFRGEDMDEHERNLTKLLAGTHTLLEQYLGKPGHSTADTRFAKLKAVRDAICQELAQYRFQIADQAGESSWN